MFEPVVDHLNLGHPLEALEQRHVAGECCLARAYYEHTAVELFAEGLRDFLHVRRAARVISDEELDLIQYDHGTRNVAVHGKDFADQTNELVGRDVLDYGELRSQPPAPA